MVQIAGFSPGVILPGCGLGQSDFAALRWPHGSELEWLAQVSGDSLFDNFEGAFNHFVQSGQVWALIIGLILGYLLRSLTAY